MTDDHIPDARKKVPAVDAPVKRRVRPLLAPRDWQAMALREAAELTGTTEGAARLAESKRYGALADEIERLRARVLDLEAVHEDASGAILQAVAAERERWQRIATNAQAVTTGCQDRIDYFKVPSHLMAALALALAEGPNAEVTWTQQRG